MKEKRPKAIKPNKSKKKPAKYYADGEDLFFMKKKPVNDAFLDRLADEYIKWAQEDDSLVLTDFPVAKGMYPKSFYLFRKRHKKLEEAHHVARAILASRRERGAITRKYDGAMIRPSLPMYSESWKENADWKKLGEWHAKLKQKDEDIKAGQGITVIIPPTPTTDLVPKKEEDE